MRASEPPSQPLYRNHFGVYTTLLSGATPLGMAKGALDYYMAHIAKRGITSTDYRVQADAPITHLQLVEAVSRIDAAEMVLTAEAKEIDRRAAEGELCDELFRAKVRYDVAKSVRECSRAIEILHRGSGASTILEKNPMQRLCARCASQRPYTLNSTMRLARRITGGRYAASQSSGIFSPPKRAQPDCLEFCPGQDASSVILGRSEIGFPVSA